MAWGARRSGRRSKGPYAATAAVSGASGNTRPSGNRTATETPGAARASTRSGSPLSAQTSPAGLRDRGSSHSGCGGGTNRGGRRTRQSSDARSVPFTAARWKTATLSSGRGSQARKAPFGATATAVPSIVSRAWPLPVAPKRNSLSRAARRASAGG